MTILFDIIPELPDDPGGLRIRVLDVWRDFVG